MKISNLWVQVGIIVIFGAAVGMAYNQFQQSPLPIFKIYKPDLTLEAGEDLSVYYIEMDAATLRDMVEAGMAVLLDARTREHYNQGHIPKAINLPIGEFKQMYDKISPLLTGDRAIIIYCIGIHCIDSSLLAKELYQKGYREIFVYKAGMEEWQQLGYPIEGQGGTSK
jgi:rhodanese-related sulfurtransferase